MTLDVATVAEPAELGMSRDALTRVSTRIRTDVAAGKYFAAAIAVARDGKVVHREDIGVVDPRSGRTAAPDDIYLMMSLSKSFTAALVLRAIDEGRFTFSTKVADILPMFAARGKSRVTIRQLLTHTAGTYSGWAPPPPLTMQDVGQLRNTVDLISALPAVYTPGSQVVYNPFASYSVLGQILVDTDPAGRTFAQIAKDDLFSPAGMNETNFGLAVDNPRRVPVSVPVSDSSVTDGGVMELLNVVLGEDAEFPAGGAFAPVSDVLRFAEILRGKGTLGDVRVLSQAIFEYACKNHTGDMVNGFWDFNRESHDIDSFPANFTFLGGYIRGDGDYLSPFGFTASPRTFGAVGGGSTMWMVDPDRDLTFVFLSAGFLEGLDHMVRLQQLSDLVLASVTD